MQNFKCKICKEFHPIETLIELPEPQIISDIMSGNLDEELIIWSKRLFIIQGKTGFFKCELTIEEVASGKVRLIEC